MSGRKKDEPKVEELKDEELAQVDGGLGFEQVSVNIDNSHQVVGDGQISVNIDNSHYIDPLAVNIDNSH
jgi:bacteriocin-like protein